MRNSTSSGTWQNSRMVSRYEGTVLLRELGFTGKWSLRRKGASNGGVILLHTVAQYLSASSGSTEWGINSSLGVISTSSSSPTFLDLEGRGATLLEFFFLKTCLFKKKNLKKIWEGRERDFYLRKLLWWKSEEYEKLTPPSYRQRKLLFTFRLLDVNPAKLIPLA